MAAGIHGFGKTWSRPRSLAAELGPAAGFRLIDGGLALSNGRLMMSGYGKLGQPWPFARKIDGVVAVWFSDNVGMSWFLADVACGSSPTLCNSTAKVFTMKITESVHQPGPSATFAIQLKVKTKIKTDDDSLIAPGSLVGAPIFAPWDGPGKHRSSSLCNDNNKLICDCSAVQRTPSKIQSSV